MVVVSLVVGFWSAYFYAFVGDRHSAVHLKMSQQTENKSTGSQPGSRQPQVIMNNAEPNQTDECVIVGVIVLSSEKRPVMYESSLNPASKCIRGLALKAKPENVVNHIS